MHNILNWASLCRSAMLVMVIVVVMVMMMRMMNNICTHLCMIVIVMVMQMRIEKRQINVMRKPMMVTLMIIVRIKANLVE